MPQITVINPTVIHKWNIEHMLLFAGTVSPGTQNRVVSLEWGIAYIESRADNALAAVGIIRRAMETEEQGAGAVIINCMDDPGLYAVRKMVTIPVLGPVEASLHLAAILGYHFSVLIVLDFMRLDDGRTACTLRAIGEAGFRACL